MTDPLRRDPLEFLRVLKKMANHAGWQKTLLFSSKGRQVGYKLGLDHYNTILFSQSMWGRALEIIKTIRNMEEDGVQPNGATYYYICNGMANAEHGYCFDFPTNPMLAKLQHWRVALNALEAAEANGFDTTDTMHNSVIISCTIPTVNQWQEGLKVLKKMLAEDRKMHPNMVHHLKNCLIRNKRPYEASWLLQKAAEENVEGFARNDLTSPVYRSLHKSNTTSGIAAEVSPSPLTPSLPTNTQPTPSQSDARRVVSSSREGGAGSSSDRAATILSLKKAIEEKRSSLNKAATRTDEVSADAKDEQTAAQTSPPPASSSPSPSSPLSSSPSRDPNATSFMGDADYYRSLLTAEMATMADAFSDRDPEVRHNIGNIARKARDDYRQEVASANATSTAAASDPNALTLEEEALWRAEQQMPDPFTAGQHDTERGSHFRPRVHRQEWYKWHAIANKYRPNTVVRKKQLAPRDSPTGVPGWHRI